MPHVSDDEWAQLDDMAGQTSLTFHLQAGKDDLWHVPDHELIGAIAICRHNLAQRTMKVLLR